MSTRYRFVDHNNLTATERQIIIDSVLHHYSENWLANLAKRAKTIAEAAEMLRSHVNGGSACREWEWSQVRGVINAEFRSGHSGCLTFHEIAVVARGGGLQLSMFDGVPA